MAMANDVLNIRRGLPQFEHGDFVSNQLLNGSNANMNVNGSATPQTFSWRVESRPHSRFIASTIAIQLRDNMTEPANFGGLTELTNGVEFYYWDGTAQTTLGTPATWKRNSDIICFCSNNYSVWNISQNNRIDLLTANLSLVQNGLQLRMPAGHGFDCVINDDLTSVDELTITIQGNYRSDSY